MKAISNDIEFRGSEDKTFKSDDGKNVGYERYFGLRMKPAFRMNFLLWLIS